MTLNRRDLRKWENSAHILFTKEQERIILDRFGNEPDDGNVWSEQDIAENIRKICRDHPTYSAGASEYTAKEPRKCSVGTSKMQHSLPRHAPDNSSLSIQFHPKSVLIRCCTFRALLLHFLVDKHIIVHGSGDIQTAFRDGTVITV